MGSRRFETAAAGKPGSVQAGHTGRSGRAGAADLASGLTPAQSWGPPARGTTGAGVVSREVQAAVRNWASGRAVSATGSFLLAAQRRYGNRFVQRLVQPPGGRRPPGAVPALQPMLRVGSPGDRYERQADLVARRVASRWPGQGPAAGQHSEGRDWAEGGEAKASPGLEASIRRPAGGGRPLASTDAGLMEQAFGTDFGRVRVHTDAGADDLCRAIGARAFTVGDHIFFGRGEQPSWGASGRHLLAHELTHVVQQRGAVPPGGYAGRASTASAPRGTIQAFWVKRGKKYFWRKRVKRGGEWIEPADDQAKFVRLENKTHSGKTVSGEEHIGPVYVEQWERPETKLEIDPEVGEETNREKTLRELRAPVVDDLRQIRRTRMGSQLLQNLAATSSKKTFIKPSKQGPLPETRLQLEGSRKGESDIKFRPDEFFDAMELFEREERKEYMEPLWRILPSDVALFHELVHAYHNAHGMTAQGRLNPGEARNTIDISVERREYQAVGLDTKDRKHRYSLEPFTENKYRKARKPKLPRRTTYLVPYKPTSAKARRVSWEKPTSAREDD